MIAISGNMAIMPNDNCPIQPLDPLWFQPYVQQVAMLRLDMLHPVVSGNKWYKLKYNMAHALSLGCDAVLTFGGAWSNHLIATAAAARAAGLKSIAIIRGLHGQDDITPTLASCHEYGMELVFVSKEEYKLKDDPQYLNTLSATYPSAFIIPEGGANEWGRAGAGSISHQVPTYYTHICLSVGSGTTLAGLRNALAASVTVYGYVPMKRGIYMREEIEPTLHPAQNINWQLFDDWHFGGFGKRNEELISFMNSFYDMHRIPLDIIYTGKMMYGIKQQLAAGFFPADARMLCIHTGGLQGNVSVKDKLLF